MKHDFFRAISHIRLRYLLVSLTICLTACKSKNAEVPYVFIEAEIIYNSIITRLPGSIYVKDRIFIWQDVFAPDSFLHIIDIENNTIYNDNILFAIVANPDYALVSMDVKHLNIPLNPKH